MLAVWLVGAVLAVLHLSERRRTARFVLAALALVAINAVVIGPLVGFVPILLVDRGMSTGGVGVAMGLVGLGRSLTHALAWGLVLAAVFLRDPPPDPVS